ncbi:MAG: pyruvate dehydrogenase complex E1 component subunit beta [Bacteriovorax sp.]|nr:pyruvate dehydrogenase complex E1 component subunit beta [Bacteriovorax sp.]
MKITYREALNLSLKDCLNLHPNSFLIGEDVGAYGGTYAVSKNLLKEFGSDKIIDAPLSEVGFTGLGIGAAMGGMKPIVEIMTINFALLAFDQIINTAAIVNFMSGGQIHLPLIIRMTSGGGRQLGAQHSNSFEGWLAHIPGLKILAPATVEDARYMLIYAMNETSPVIIIEHALLFNISEECPDVLQEFNPFHAQLKNVGKDLTLITYGGMLPRCMQACAEMKKKGFEIEVIDLRCLRPLDNKTIFSSVKKNHRVLIVDEGWRSGSLAAEISSRITENCFYDLDAPVYRLCRKEFPIPYPRHLEEAIIPRFEDIVIKLEEILK